MYFLSNFRRLKTKDKIASILIPILFISGFVYVIYLDNTKLIRRNKKLNKMNSSVGAKLITIEKLTGGYQGPEGNEIRCFGYALKYQYEFKDKMYTNEEHIDNDKNLSQIMDLCSQLNPLDSIQIKIDTLRPNISLIDFN